MTPMRYGAKNNPIVRVVFEDSWFEYSYYSGGLHLRPGDLVVTPRPSSNGRFGFQRYNEQGVAQVVGFGTSYGGALKTLVGRVVTAGEKTQPNEVQQTAAPRPMKRKKIVGLGDSLVIDDVAFEIGRHDAETIGNLVARVRKLENQIPVGVEVDVLRNQLKIGSRSFDLFDLCIRLQNLEDRLDRDQHTHDGKTSPPKRVQRIG